MKIYNCHFRADDKIQTVRIKACEIVYKILNFKKLIMESVKKVFSSAYQQYEIITCISILEPWEKKIISKSL